MAKGIDYGMGTTNIDRETGIRFGVIHQNEVLQAWADNSEADYGDPHCPECGNDAVDGDSEIDVDTLAEDGSEEGVERCEELGYVWKRGACGDYACDNCCILFDGDSAFGDQPLGWTLDDGEYKATQSGDDCDIFVTKSPYFTSAQFCSPCAPGAPCAPCAPCAPGACYLANPCEDGERAYCFSHDWFEDNKAPYPVYRVDNGELVKPEESEG